MLLKRLGRARTVVLDELLDLLVHAAVGILGYLQRVLVLLLRLERDCAADREEVVLRDKETLALGQPEGNIDPTCSVLRILEMLLLLS